MYNVMYMYITWLSSAMKISRDSHDVKYAHLINVVAQYVNNSGEKITTTTSVSRFA